MSLETQAGKQFQILGGEQLTFNEDQKFQNLISAIFPVTLF